MLVQELAKLGFVKGVGKATPLTNPRKILLGDPYWTDGLRAVMLLSEKPVAMDKISFFICDFRMKGADVIIERLGREVLSKP